MIKKYLIVMIIILSGIGCSTKHNYLEGNTQVRVEYFGELEVANCYPNLRCNIKSNAKCIIMLDEQAKLAAQRGLEGIKNQNFSLAAEEFSFALCNTIGIDEIIKRMKSDNRSAWKTLRKSGYIDNIRMRGMKLMLLIEQCEQLAAKEME